MGLRAMLNLQSEHDRLSVCIVLICSIGPRFKSFLSLSDETLSLRSQCIIKCITTIPRMVFSSTKCNSAADNIATIFDPFITSNEFLFN